MTSLPLILPLKLCFFFQGEESKSSEKQDINEKSNLTWGIRVAEQSPVLKTQSQLLLVLYSTSSTVIHTHYESKQWNMRRGKMWIKKRKHNHRRGKSNALGYVCFELWQIVPKNAIQYRSDNISPPALHDASIYSAWVLFMIMSQLHLRLQRNLEWNR